MALLKVDFESQSHSREPSFYLTFVKKVDSKSTIARAQSLQTIFWRLLIWVFG